MTKLVYINIPTKINLRKTENTATQSATLKTMKMLGTVVLALSIASGRAHPTPTHEDLNGLPDQTPNEPLSVLRLDTRQCIERPFEYFDKETLTCESCGVICGQWGPRSEHCLKEPNCQGRHAKLL